MKKSESALLETWINETQETYVTPDGVERTREIIRFTPEIMLFHDGHPAHVLDLREALAEYLRRIAKYLEA